MVALITTLTPYPFIKLMIKNIEVKKFFLLGSNLSQIQWYSRILWVGIGCTKNTSKTLIEQGLKDIFCKFSLTFEAIAGLSTIDLKQEEKGILELSKEYNFPLVFFTSKELNQISVPNPRDLVNKKVETPSVAEASAICAATKFNSFLTTDQLLNKIPNYSLIIPKQIIKKEGEKGAVTIAVVKSNIG